MYNLWQGGQPNQHGNVGRQIGSDFMNNPVNGIQQFGQAITLRPPSTNQNEQRQMQIENDVSNPFLLIQEEQIDNSLKARVVDSMINLKYEVSKFKQLSSMTLKMLEEFSQHIQNYENSKFQQPNKQNEQKLKMRESFFEQKKESNICAEFYYQLTLIMQLIEKKQYDFHQDLQEYIKLLEKTYILSLDNLVKQLQEFDKVTRNIEYYQDIGKFLQYSENVKSVIANVKFLEEYPIETKILQQIQIALNPQKNLQQFIVYQSLQEKGRKIENEYIDKLKTINQFSVDTFKSFIVLLNKYYNYQNLGEDQQNYQIFVYTETTSQLKDYQYLPKLYLFYYNDAQQQCIILEKQSNQNARTYCLPKMRLILQEILKEINQQQNSLKMEQSLNFEEGVQLFLFLIGIKVTQQDILKFMLEFSIYNKDNQLDIYEFEKLFKEQSLQK